HRGDGEDAVLHRAGDEVLQAVVGFGEGAAHEGHTNLVRAGAGGEADVLGAAVDGIHRRALVEVQCDAVGIAAKHRAVHLAVVHGDDHRVLELDVVHPGVQVEVADVDRVL